jgi:hypothetical protein
MCMCPCEVHGARFTARVFACTLCSVLLSLSLSLCLSVYLSLSVCLSISLSLFLSSSRAPCAVQAGRRSPFAAVFSPVFSDLSLTRLVCRQVDYHPSAAVGRGAQRSTYSDDGSHRHGCAKRITRLEGLRLVCFYSYIFVFFINIIIALALNESHCLKV